ncbi:phage tail tape measure protein [Cohaesibacter marisflavi]|uniref:phage tail tape measure protein n=1 Tax=Cohaesibacter marisflavi TaxID=655353 RepID=UPI0029C77EA9|nr:phage tail tape measure protein [Cohaesibacter marisflavi]
MGVLTSKLILSLVDRVSAPARAVKQTMDSLKLAQAANNRKMAEMRGRMVDAAAMGYVMSRALAAPVKSAMAFESAMADVNKVVDFSAPDGLKQMSADILAMSKRIPMAATGIANIVAAAGQAGMQGGELLQFAEMAAKVGVAFDISADQAGESLAKIKTALGLSVSETRALADAMNYLSNTSASSAPDLLDFMSRVGAIGQQYGFTEQQTVALGSAMIAAGAQSEVAATSFRNVGKALVRGENATKGQRAAFAKLGLDATDVAKRMQKDAVGTLRDVISRIRKLPKELQAANISALFGDEARAIAPLISNAKLLDQALASVSDETKYLGSAQAEYEVRAKTTENALQLFKNQMEGLSIAIGSALLPALTKIVELVGPIIGALADWAAAHPQVTTAVVGLVTALVAARVAATAMRFAFLFGKGGLLSLAMVVPRLASAFLTLINPMALVRGAMMALRVALASTGIGLVVAGVAMAGAWIYNNWSNLSAMFTAFGAAFMRAIKPMMPVIEPVLSGIQWLWDSITGLVDTVGGGTGQWQQWGAAAGRAVGDILVAFTALPGKIYAFAADAASRLWDGLKSNAPAVADLVGPILNHYLTLGRDLFEAGRAAIAKLFEGLRTAQSAGDVVQAIIDAFLSLGEGLYKAGRAAMQRLWDGLKEMAQQVIDWATGIADKIAAPFRAIGNVIGRITGSVKAPGVNGGHKSRAKTPAIAGAKAAGGAVAGGKTYLVGELGAELVTPSRSGYVHTADATQKMLGGQGAAPQGGFGDLNVSFGNLILPGVSNADELIDELESRIRESFAGLQADLTMAEA